mgnify:CR=1 FL=1
MNHEKNSNTITLIVPMYNVEDYIEKCLKSVFHQTIPFDEVIVIDDGSTDRSLEICKGVLQNYSNTVLISQSNEGLGFTRNRGIQIANCEYIFFLDSDDELTLDTVEQLKEQILTEEYDVVYFAGTILRGNTVTNEHSIYRKHGLDTSSIYSGKDYFEKTYSHYFNVSPCMALYKVDFLKKNKIYFQERVFYEDNFFSIKTMLFASKVICLENEFYLRRIRSGSIMQSPYTEKKMYDLYKVAEEIYALVTQNIDIRQLPNSRYEDLIWKYYLNFMVVHEKYFRDSNIKNHCLDLINKIGWFTGLAEPVEASCIEKKYRLLKIIKDNNIFSNRLLELLDHLHDENEKNIRNKLKLLKFDDPEKTIGIYGTGVHTDNMLRAYENRFGIIKAKLVFYTTEKKEAVYRNLPVYSINELSDDLDMLVISSFRYMYSMIETARKVNQKIFILELYSKENIDGFGWI